MQGYKIPHKVRVSNLKRKRIERGIKQAELADLSGVPLKCIGNYEQLRRDINRARVDIVYSLAAALNCRIEELLEGKDLL
ncbi:MAG: helix-turn-helix transcriptional regulator [Lachnospiraceae bacterium]|nr:helix-turn-helix transcriptional regulator [Lachnospiraceae bacterium]